MSLSKNAPMVSEYATQLTVVVEGYIFGPWEFFFSEMEREEASYFMGWERIENI